MAIPIAHITTILGHLGRQVAMAKRHAVGHSRGLCDYALVINSCFIKPWFFMLCEVTNEGKQYAAGYNAPSYQWDSSN